MNDVDVPANCFNIPARIVCVDNALHRHKPIQCVKTWPAGISFVFGQADLVVSTVTISSKVHPQAKAFLDQTAREVNDVWNFCNQTSYKAWNNYVGQRTWLSAFEMNNLLAGCGDVFAKIGIDVAQSVAAEHANKRNQTHYSKLN